MGLCDASPAMDAVGAGKLFSFQQEDVLPHTAQVRAVLRGDRLRTEALVLSSVQPPVTYPHPTEPLPGASRSAMLKGFGSFRWPLCPADPPVPGLVAQSRPSPRRCPLWGAAIGLSLRLTCGRGTTGYWRSPGFNGVAEACLSPGDYLLWKYFIPVCADIGPAYVQGMGQGTGEEALGK